MFQVEANFPRWTDFRLRTMGYVQTCVLSNIFLRTSKDQSKKTSLPDSWTPGNVFLSHQSVRSCALILNLNAHSRAPEFRYRNTPPAPYEGMQLERHVHNPQTPQALQKQLQTDQNHVKAESEQRSIKCRHTFTDAEVGVLLQNVNVSIVLHYGYIQAIEFSAYSFIHLHFLCCAVLLFLGLRRFRSALEPQRRCRH